MKNDVGRKLNALLLSATLLVAAAALPVAVIVLAFTQGKKMLFPEDYWTAEASRTKQRALERIEEVKSCERASSQRLESSGDFYLKLLNQGLSQPQALEALTSREDEINSICHTKRVAAINAMKEYKTATEHLSASK